MSTKAFGIYSSKGDDAAQNNDELIIEIGNSHTACLVKGRDNIISDFELFTLNKEETSDFKNLFSDVVAKSQMLSKTYTDTRFYINNEFALLVPATKFDEEILNDFLNVAFGEDENSIPRFDAIDGTPNLINAFRVSDEWLSIIEQHFKLGKIQHSYTPVIRPLITEASNATFIKVQFYPAYFSAIVMKDGALQFIRSFIYQSSDDVLYYLLSINERFDLNTTELTIFVSGMIDLKSALHTQLEKFFLNIVVEEVDKSKLAIDISEYPAHYFTPFFNLAL